MGSCMSVEQRKLHLAITKCSFSTHYLTNKPRLNDLDFCSHPYCANDVILHYKNQYTETRDRLISIILKKEEEIERLIELKMIEPVKTTDLESLGIPTNSENTDLTTLDKLASDIGNIAQ